MKKIVNLYFPLLIIIIFSLFTLYTYDTGYFVKQSIWIFLGILLLFLFNFFKFNKLLKYTKYLYFTNLLLLILVLFIGKEINGAKAWFSFKYFSFQPSEFMKFSLTLHLTNLYINKPKYYFIKSLLIFIIPSILVFLEPDTGAIIMYLIIYLAFLFFSLKRKKLFYIFCLIGLLILIILLCLYFYNLDFLIKLFGSSIFYRIDRILNFKNNYQLENALISIGTTSFIGRKNKALLYIPESITDFMFAKVVSSKGYLIGLLLLLCYFFILKYLIANIKNNYKSVFSFCFFWLFFIQLCYNISMNLGLVPIMGIPLPFLSYGGSNTIIYFLFLGIILGKN